MSYESHNSKNPEEIHSLEYSTMMGTVELLTGVMSRRLKEDIGLKCTLLPIYVSYRFEPRLRSLTNSIVFNVDNYDYSHRDVKYAVENNLSICRPSNNKKYIKMIQFSPYKLQFYWINDLKNRWVVQLESEMFMLSLIDTGLKIKGKYYMVRDFMEIQRIEIQLWREAKRNDLPDPKLFYSPIL